MWRISENKRRNSLFALAVCALACDRVSAADARSNFVYESTVTVDADGNLDLVAELNYNDAVHAAPIAVVMHGFSPTNGNLANVRANASRLRDAGFFAISVAMRGRDGSDGVRDSGGLEIYDIYDAVESVKEAFPTLVDSTNVHITGYSGGGGNVMSALTKFPDYFRAGSSFFGMSDYGFDPVISWYHQGASSGHQAILNNDVGNPITGDPVVLDKYHARASALASRNNPFSEIHLFVNSDEVTSPLINHTSFRDRATAEASFPAEFDNITVHVGDPAMATYEDFNGNALNDLNELQYWPHGFPTANQQESAELWYRDRLLDGSIPEPTLNASDELLVAGFVKTQHFELRLGDGQNAVGELEYLLSPTRKSFDVTILSSDLSTTGTLWVDLTDMSGPKVDVFLNGKFVESAPADDIYQFSGLGHDDTVVLKVPELSTFALAAFSFVGLAAWGWPRRLV